MILAVKIERMYQVVRFRHLFDEVDVSEMKALYSTRLIASMQKDLIFLGLQLRGAKIYVKQQPNLN